MHDRYITIDVSLLQRIVRAANDEGKNGRRAKWVTVIPAPTAAGEDVYIFDVDNGPETASESWRD